MSKKFRELKQPLEENQSDEQIEMQMTAASVLVNVIMPSLIHALGTPEAATAYLIRCFGAPKHSENYQVEDQKLILWDIRKIGFALNHGGLIGIDGDERQITMQEWLLEKEDTKRLLQQS